MSYKPLKIGVLGGIRAGKDTVSKLLARELSKVNNSKSEYFAFSKGIHDVLYLTMPEIYSKGKPREVLQHVGQSLRQVNPDIWVNYLFRHHEYITAEVLKHNIIITDVRQPNEVQRLKERGFLIVKVTASKEVRLQRALKAGDNFTVEDFEHETEISMEKCPYDYLINNSCSLYELEQRVAELVKEITGGS